MSKKTRQQARLLVQSILRQDHLTSQKLFKKLITEAEEARQDQAAAEGADDGDDLFDDDQGDGEGSDEGNDAAGAEKETDAGTNEGEGEGQGSDEFEEQGGMSNDQVNEIVDDQIQINCQINASILEDLLNKVAELKTAFENMDLDKHDRQYYEIKVPLQYYSEKLQKLQNKTNPGVDQEQVKQQLEDIKTSLDELQGTINGGGADTEEQVMSPDEVNANTEQDDSQESEEGQTEAEGQEQQGEAEGQGTEGQGEEADQQDLFS